jgi:hypothetical protein
LVIVLVTASLASLAEAVWFQEGFFWAALIMLGIQSLSNSILDIIMKLVT